MPAVDADTVFGIYAPAGTSPAIVARLHDEINRALATPKMAGVVEHARRRGRELDAAGVHRSPEPRPAALRRVHPRSRHQGRVIA